MSRNAVLVSPFIQLLRKLFRIHLLLKNLSAASFIFLSSSLSIAQTGSISGLVYDQTDLPLPGSGVALLNTSDSALIAGSVTDTSGRFLLSNILYGDYLLRISYIGFDDRFSNVTVNSPTLTIERVILREKSLRLKEVTVEDKLPAVQAIGDTMQYNADAYKTSKDATAEDLATKMPGITIQDGKVQAQGEDVKKVLIDGKPFLGDDPNAALKNLPAEVVEKIQVFDKKSDQSEFTGFDDGNSSKTINIVTRPQFRNGVFGRTFAGAGTEETWKAGLSINSFKDKRKFTVLGNSNNINEQNFASDDLLGVVGTSAGNRGGRRGPRGGGGGRWQQNDADNFLVDQRNGISKTNSAGINYANEWKKLDFTFSYFFNKTENRSASDIFRHYYTTDVDGLTYTEDNLSLSTNTNHRANMKLEYKFDTLNSILLQPRITVQENTGSSISHGINADSAGSISDASTLFNSNLNAISFSSPLLYRHSFQKKGRTFSAYLSPTYTNNTGDNNLNSLTSYSTDTLEADTLNQVSDLIASGWKNYSQVVFTEPIGEKNQLSISYKGNYNFDKSDKETFSYSPSDELYNQLDTQLTNKFESSYISHAGGFNLRRQNDKWNMMAGISYQVARLKNERIFPFSSRVDKEFKNVLPIAMLQYKFTPKKNIRLFMRSSNNSPSVSQLQDVVNNNNPLQLTTGNPELQQDNQTSMSLRYSAVNTEKNTSFFGYLSGTYSLNYISNSTIIASTDTLVGNDTYLPAGSQLTKPVNIDGYISIRNFFNFSFPLKVLKSTLNLNSNSSYSRSPSLINNEKNFATTINTGLGFSLSSNISEYIDFLISSNAGYNHIRNTIQEKSNNNYYSFTSKFKIQVQPWKGLVLQTDATYQQNSGLSATYNQDYVLWNAGIGYKFMKANAAEVRITVYDILEKNKSISRNTTDAYYEDVQSNVLGQYFMLTFTYNLKFFKIKTEE